MRIALAVALGIRWAAGGSGGGWFALAAGVAPALAIATILLVPVEF